MNQTLPNDDDGDAIRRLLDDGSTLGNPISIDFQVVVPTQTAAETLEKKCSALGYKTRLGDEGHQWLVECTIDMVLTYDAIIAKQEELAAAAKPFGGKVDGWGSFGN